MSPDRQTKLSKFLSYHLRHAPQELGLTLQPGGWIEVEDLLGHSVEVDLKLEPMGPPEILYHGTAEQFVKAILETGLQKMSRHHVHLSADIQTAQKVGMRRGKVAIFQVNAAAMDADGVIFYQSDNGVWLTDCVAPQYLKLTGT
jgi:putative RNA 2'-phosphotransferase